MADQKINIVTITKDMQRRKISVTTYFPLILLAITITLSFIMLNSFNLGFIMIILLFFVFIPLIVTFTEYNAFLESGGRTENFFKTISVLYRTTFKTGRTRYFLNIKTILLYVLYVFTALFAFTGLVLIFISIFVPQDYVEIVEIFTQMTALSSVDDFNALYDTFKATFSIYLEIIDIGSHLIIFSGFLYILNRGIFRVYTSLFIDQRPLLPYEVVDRAFFSDKSTRRAKNQAMFTLLALLSVIYTISYIGTFYLFKGLTVNGNYVLQAALVSVALITLLLPYLLRYNYALYFKLIADKREEVLIFIIQEISEILKTPGIPPESIEYLQRIMNMRKEELAGLRYLKQGPKEETKEEPEKEKAP